MVMTIVQNFLSDSSNNIRASEIGIVTPYAAQVRQLKERCRLSPFDLVEVASVDGFQGREKEVIVFSCVRANSSGNLGFLADARRVNVMMTRAKRGLVIIGSPITLLAERSTWAPWLQWAHENGLIVGGVPAKFELDFIKMPRNYTSTTFAPAAVQSDAFYSARGVAVPSDFDYHDHRRTSEFGVRSTEFFKKELDIAIRMNSHDVHEVASESAQTRRSFGKEMHMSSGLDRIFQE